MKQFDVIVIGSGPGGHAAAIRAAQFGFKTACIEKAPSPGGTCLNVGCIPSKSLLYASEFYASVQQHRDEFGIRCENVGPDFPKMQARKEEVVKGLVSGVSFLFKKYKVELITGEAHFLSPTTIELAPGKEQLTAQYFILATGSEPTPLPFLPFDEKQILSSTGTLALSKVPKKLVVIGAGVIGVELASVYRRLGAEVEIVEMLDRICPAMDMRISKELLHSLQKQGILFRLNAKVVKAQKNKNSVSIEFEKENQKKQADGDLVLVAIGRRPYSANLNLEALGIQQQKGVVVVDGNFRTSHSHIFAIGDLIEGPMLAHKAMVEGAAVAEIIAGHLPKVNYLTIPNIVYTHPEAASVGLTEQEVVERKIAFSTGTALFRANSRARCVGENEGFVKVIGGGKEQALIGMHIFGPQASELINFGTLAIEKEMTLVEIAHSPIGHPTFSEAIKEACESALGKAVH